MHHSGPLTVTLKPIFDLDGKIEDLEVVEVQGDTTVPAGCYCSEVDWASEDLSNLGALDALFDGVENVPTVKPDQRLRVACRVWSQECLDGDWDGGFDVDSVEVFDAPVETAQQTVTEGILERMDALPWQKIGPGEYEKVLVVDGIEWELEHICCQDCKLDRWPCFMLQDDLWEQLGLDGYICPNCAQKRVQKAFVRGFQPSDFNAAPVNHWVAEWLKVLESMPDFPACVVSDALVHNGRTVLSARKPLYFPGGDLPD